MVLVINRGEVEGHLSPEDAIQAMEQAYRELGNDPSISHPRRRLHVHFGRNSTDWTQTRMSSFIGALPKMGYMGANLRVDRYKLTTERTEYQLIGDNIYLLYDVNTGHQLAIIHGGNHDKSDVETLAIKVASEPMRTAALTALGTRLLARKDSKTMGFFGAGYHAPSNLAYVCKALQIEHVNVFTRTREKRETFAREMSRILGINVNPVEEAKKAVSGCDVIVTCTNSNVPVFDGNWISPGTHVSSIVAANKEYGLNRKEVDDLTVGRSSIVVVNSKDQAIQDQHATICEPIEHKMLDWSDVHELSELLLGQTQGRRSNEDITFYHNGVGQGVADLAIAAKTYETALKLGLGKDFREFTSSGTPV